jgi:hypothetical protein
VSSLVDQPPDRRRRTVGLGLEPVPVSRQQGHLPTDDAELRAPRPRLRLAASAREHLVDRSAEVEVNLPSRRLLEDQYRLPGLDGALLRGAEDIVEGAGCDESVFSEGDVGRVGRGRILEDLGWSHGPDYTRVILASQ